MRCWARILHLYFDTGVVALLWRQKFGIQRLVPQLLHLLDGTYLGIESSATAQLEPEVTTPPFMKVASSNLYGPQALGLHSPLHQINILTANLSLLRLTAQTHSRCIVCWNAWNVPVHFQFLHIYDGIKTSHAS
jgi:hypothetical protein